MFLFFDIIIISWYGVQTLDASRNEGTAERLILSLGEAFWNTLGQEACHGNKVFDLDLHNRQGS